MTVPHRRALPRFIICLGVSVALGLISTTAIVGVLACFCDPPNTPANTSRTFIRDGLAWTVVESHRFGIARAWWSQLTRADMTAPQSKSPLTRAGEFLGISRTEKEDPATLLTEYRALYADLIRSRPGGRIFETPSLWGEFSTSDPLPRQNDIGCDVAYGWPFKCAWYQVRGSSRGNTATTEQLRFAHLIRGTPATRGDLFCRIIPLRPAWPGLAANTGVFSGLWAIIFFVPPLVRRAVRLRRDLCEKCGYSRASLAPNSPCPECGHAART